MTWQSSTVQFSTTIRAPLLGTGTPGYWSCGWVLLLEKAPNDQVKQCQCFLYNKIIWPFNQLYGLKSLIHISYGEIIAEIHHGVPGVFVRALQTDEVSHYSSLHYALGSRRIVSSRQVSEWGTKLLFRPILWLWETFILTRVTLRLFWLLRTDEQNVWNKKLSYDSMWNPYSSQQEIKTLVVLAWPCYRHEVSTGPLVYDRLIWP